MPEPILVVSGLPRSGTSLVMQMFTAGGVEPLTDGERAADEDNPRGYLELEAVKSIQRGAPWVADARGRVVKVISHLLPALPPGESYRVVFIERDLDEVLASQAKMIARRGAQAPPQQVVRQAFESHLAAFDRLAKERDDFEALRIPYAGIVADPAQAAEALAVFAERDRPESLDRASMASAVDPALYRNRRQA